MKRHYPKMCIIAIQSVLNSQVLFFGWLEVLLGVRYFRSTCPPTRQLTAALAGAEESSPISSAGKRMTSPFPPSPKL